MIKNNEQIFTWYSANDQNVTPPIEQPILLCFSNGGIEIGTYSKSGIFRDGDNEPLIDFKDGHFINDGSVIAWGYLPKPFSTARKIEVPGTGY